MTDSPGADEGATGPADPPSADADPVDPRVGRAVAVEPVPAAEVPGDYPAEIASDRALAVRLEFEDADGGAVYYAWPPADDGPLERLLDLRDVWQDRVEDLRGERVPVGVVDGHYVPVAPEERPHGSALGFYGLVLGLGGTLAIFAGLVSGLLAPTMAVATALLVINLVLLPTATYLDGWYLRTRTDWDRDPLFWAALAGFVGLNVVSIGAYLWLRRSAASY